MFFCKYSIYLTICSVQSLQIVLKVKKNTTPNKNLLLRYINKERPDVNIPKFLSNLLPPLLTYMFTNFFTRFYINLNLGLRQKFSSYSLKEGFKLFDLFSGVRLQKFFYSCTNKYLFWKRIAVDTSFPGFF